MKLIDKDALVAEIEKLRHQVDLSTRHGEGLADAYHAVNKLITSLEVEEVDLEKEYKDFVEEDPVYNKLVNGIVGKAIAKHFFELGIAVSNKAKKGE